jgi:hypothetical protein
MKELYSNDTIICLKSTHQRKVVEAIRAVAIMALQDEKVIIAGSSKRSADAGAKSFSNHMEPSSWSVQPFGEMEILDRISARGQPPIQKI